MHAFTVTQLIGHWRVRRLVFCFDWILRADGSFTGKCSVLGIPIMRLSGTWSVEGDQLVCIYHKRFLMPGGVKDTDTLVEVAPDYFNLVTRRGTRRRWDRIITS